MMARERGDDTDETERDETENQLLSGHVGEKSNLDCGSLKKPSVQDGNKSDHDGKKATDVSEDDDDKYSVEDIPLYDSEDDEPTSKFQKAIVIKKDLKPLSIQPENSGTSNGRSFHLQETQQKSIRRSSKTSRVGSKSSPHKPNRKSKNVAREQINVGLIGERLSKEARDKLLAYEETKNAASTKLNSLYDEIRPAIEEHERDSQDSVSTTVAERWIEANCSQLKAEFDLFSSIIKNVACTPKTASYDATTKTDDADIK